MVCSCKLFVRRGILCRHIFCVFKNSDIQEIPQQYILRRWKRDIIPPKLRNKRNRYGETNEAVEKLANEAYSTVDDCVNLLCNDEEKLASFVQKVKLMKTEIEGGLPNLPARKKSDIIEKLIGVSKPETNEVQNPQGIRTKGCGRDKRLKGAKEKAITDSLKPLRQCQKCFEYTNKHDKRNCEKVKAKAAKEAAIKATKEATKEVAETEVAKHVTKRRCRK